MKPLAMFAARLLVAEFASRIAAVASYVLAQAIGLPTPLPPVVGLVACLVTYLDLLDLTRGEQP